MYMQMQGTERKREGEWYIYIYTWNIINELLKHGAIIKKILFSYLYNDLLNLNIKK